MKGKILNIRDFEQGIDQINRLKSNNAKLDFAPGEEKGLSNVLIKNNKSKKWNIYSELNNSGLDLVGQWQLYNTISFENLLRINELWLFSYGQDISGSNDGHFSDLLSLQVSVPYGYWLFTTGLSKSSYQNDSIINLLEINSTGKTGRFFIFADYVTYRDQNRKVTLNLGVRHSGSKNRINNILLKTSSRRLTVANIGLSYEGRLNNGLASISSSLNYHRGLKWMNAKDDDDRVGLEPYAQYDLFTFDFSYSKKFDFKSKPFYYTTYLNAQYAPKEIFSSEGINIGGNTSVRGFREESVIGSSGGYLRQELSFPIYKINSEKLIEGKSKLSKIFEVLEGDIISYVHYDAGGIFGAYKEDRDEGLLQSIGIGSRYQAKNFGINIGISQLLSKPDSLEKNDPIFTLNFNVKY